MFEPAQPGKHINGVDPILSERWAEVQCRKCGTDTFLPFQCQYCGQYFCSQHRLPENHDCSRIDRARAPREELQPVATQKSKSRGLSVTFPYTKEARSIFHFSIKETEHLLIGIVLVAGVGLSLIGLHRIVYEDYGVLALYTSMFTISFFIHEIAHKAVAQRHGLWAEFRLTLVGVLLTALSIVSPFIKIIAPGAVMVAGPFDIRVLGKTSTAGPATNIVLAATLLGLTLTIQDYGLIFARVAFFNGWIAIFNLVPLGILDGFKIFKWDKKIWILLFASSLAVTILCYRYF